MPSKEEYIKEHGVSERAFLIYCINALTDDDMRINGDNINDLKGFLYELVDEHFKLKEKYNKILDDVHDYRYETHCMKMTIRNLCEHFGVENEKGLQNIYLNKPYIFEDLHDFMAYHDKILDKDCLIAQVCDKENISICWYEEENMLTEDWVEFEENRFYPVQYANEVINNVR